MADEEFKVPLPGGLTTLEELKKVYLETETKFDILPLDNLSSVYPTNELMREYRNELDLDCDEIIDNLFYGNAVVGKNSLYLKNLGITHIVNAIPQFDSFISSTSMSFDQDFNILRVSAFDSIFPGRTFIHYSGSSTFISNALDRGGKVLVHGLKGLTRGANIILAYLMMELGMTATEAIPLVRKRREIILDDNHLEQIVDLDNVLRRKRMKTHSSTCCSH